MFPYFEYNANCVVLAPFLFQPISAVFNNNKKKKWKIDARIVTPFPFNKNKRHKITKNEESLYQHKIHYSWVGKYVGGLVKADKSNICHIRGFHRNNSRDRY